MQIQVERDGHRSEVLLRAIGYYGPGIFSYQPNTSSSDRYASMMNQDLTANSREHPAKAGSIASIWVTGLGQTDPPGADGALGAQPKAPQHPVRILVNSKEARIDYVGIAPGLIEGVMQINFQVPIVPAGTATASIEIQMGNGVPARQSSRMYFYVAE